MTPEIRMELLEAIGEMCRYFPSYRLCQMIANLGTLAGAETPDALARLTDAELSRTARDTVRGRKECLGGNPPEVLEGDTLPAFLPEIEVELVRRGQHNPELSFAQLVQHVAEQTRAFAPFDFWDVEDADFLRALREQTGALAGRLDFGRP